MALLLLLLLLIDVVAWLICLSFVSVILRPFHTLCNCNTDVNVALLLASELSIKRHVNVALMLASELSVKRLLL